MRHTALLLSLVLSAAAPAQKAVEWWPGSWEKAFEEAKKRNVPLLIGINQDGEEANDRVALALYKDPAFIKLSAFCVPILGSKDNHGQEMQDLRGGATKVCSRFGGVPCQTHQEHERRAVPLLFAEKGVSTPFHAVVLPDESVSNRLHDVHEVSLYEQAVKEAQRTLGPGLTAEQYRSAEAALKAARAAAREDKIPETVAALAELDKAARGTPVAKEGEEIVRAMEAKARTLIEEAKGEAKAGRHADALRRLARGLSAFKGAAVAKEIKDADTAIRKSKEGQAAAALLAKEDKARPAFDKGRDLETQKDFVKAAREYLKVLGAAPGTPLAADAEARLAAMKDDPDVGPLVAPVLAEREADEALKAAQAALRKGEKTQGTSLLKELIAKWPKSAAADRARKLLESGG